MSKKTKSRIVFFALSYILFLACISVSLRTSGYALPFGWQHNTQDYVSPEGLDLPDGYSAVCDRVLVENGFPFTYEMPYDDVSDCSNQYNRLAIVLDLLLALIVSVGVGWAIVRAAGKRFER